MVDKKEIVFRIVFLYILILSFSLVSSLNIYSSSRPVIGTIINDHDKPAVFDFTFTNNGPSSTFELYTYEKFKILPVNFSLSSPETKVISFEFYPIESMKDNAGYIDVPVYIRDKLNPNGETLASKLLIKLINFKDAFDVGGENINLNSSQVTAYFYNKEDVTYNNIKITFSSSFIEDTSETINLNPYQKYQVIIPINKDKLKKLVAGIYDIRANVDLDGKTQEIKGAVKIVEQSGLSVSESSSGFIIRTDKIEKMNNGNVPTVADIYLRKNIISRLFTTFSLQPSNVKRNGLFIDYTWQKELNPDETLSVNVITNWIFPLILLVLVIIIVGMFNIYVKQNLSIKKKVGFVRTKNNDFALKVTLHVKARKFMEKVIIYDRLPGIAKLYEKFGEPPTKFDSNSGRMQWEIPRMAEGEERVFSYVFYSKINIVGKFELPAATGLYEMQGKLFETKSNRAFFINETKKIRAE
jgi:hypothetical protein